MTSMQSNSVNIPSASDISGGHLLCPSLGEREQDGRKGLDPRESQRRAKKSLSKNILDIYFEAVV